MGIEVEEIFSINVRAPLTLAERQARLLERHAQGRISSTGRFGLYSRAKAALLMSAPRRVRIAA